MGVSFLCPCCSSTRASVWFENPLDGLPGLRGASALRRGATLDELGVSERVVVAGHCTLVVHNGAVIEVQ